MENFQLLFSTDFEDGIESIIDVGKVSRVIVSENFEMANAIAKAMLGEEVSAHEYLSSLISVEQTSKPPEINAWNVSAVWDRVLENFGLSRNEAILIRNDNKIVGIKLL